MARSRNVATLPQEGQHVEGFAGPVPLELGLVHFFSENEMFTDMDAYDWPGIRRVWEAQWEANNPQATIRVEKSPPNVVRMGMLDTVFPDAYFIVSWRNPYAMAEGILRNNPKAQIAQAGRHALRMLRYARENTERYGDRMVAMSYEEIAAAPQSLLDRLVQLLPEIGPLRVEAASEIVVKGSLYSSIHDMNAEQIANLSPWMIKQLNRVFEPYRDLLEAFDYELLPESAGRGDGFRPAPLTSRTPLRDAEPDTAKRMAKGDFDYFCVGQYEGVGELADQVRGLGAEWDQMTFRQDQKGPHVDTRTVALRWVQPPKYDVVHAEHEIARHHYDVFGDHIERLEALMAERYGPGYFLRVILTRVPSGKRIPRHADTGRSFAVSHRVHMAVITDPAAKFYVNDVEKSMAPGELWEINNFRSHEVRNDSGIDRVHLIGDWYNPDEGPLYDSMAKRLAPQS
ncbi:MAG: aspartyl/asparaginyl beta-hydroxylase domain-containing protein [Pseudomonadota bacterium]